MGFIIKKSKQFLPMCGDKLPQENSIVTVIELSAHTVQVAKVTATKVARTKKVEAHYKFSRAVSYEPFSYEAYKDWDVYGVWVCSNKEWTEIDVGVFVAQYSMIMNTWFKTV